MDKILSHHLLFPFDNSFSGTIEYYAFGRGAINQALKLITANEKRTVLLPEFLCSTILLPFSDNGVSYRYYNITNSLEPSINSIEDKLDKRVCAVYYINYFGFPAKNTESLKKLCSENNIYLIEDNAHGYLSYTENKALGRFGDLSIFSLRKTLPILSGAALVLNNNDLTLDETKVHPPNPEFKYRSLLKRSVRLSGEYLNMPFKRYKSLNEVIDSEDDKVKNYHLGRDKYSNFIISRIDKKRIVNNRRNDYKKILSYMKANYSITPIYDSLPSGICPYAVPIFADGKNEVIHKLRKDKFRVSEWPNLPHDVDKGSTKFLKENLFTILLAY